MDVPDEKTGVTHRQNLQQVVDSTPPDINVHKSALVELSEEPEFPVCAEHIWNWFWDLSGARGAGFSGPLPISYSEIQAWDTLKNMDVTELEVNLIKHLDRVYLKFMDKKQRD